MKVEEGESEREKEGRRRPIPPVLENLFVVLVR